MTKCAWLTRFAIHLFQYSIFHTDTIQYSIQYSILYILYILYTIYYSIYYYSFYSIFHTDIHTYISQRLQNFLHILIPSVFSVVDRVHQKVHVILCCINVSVSLWLSSSMSLLMYGSLSAAWQSSVWGLMRCSLVTDWGCRSTQQEPEQRRTLVSHCLLATPQESCAVIGFSDIHICKKPNHVHWRMCSMCTDTSNMFVHTT